MSTSLNIPQNPISAYIINLKKREDRRKHALEQFAGKPEFSPVIVPAHEMETGAMGLWSTIREILSFRADPQSEFVLICEDDHLFTEHYSCDLLEQCIAQAIEKQADILIGGPSWFENAFSRTSHLYWVEKFTGFQFVFIFRKFIPILLAADFTNNDVADLFISKITDAKYFIAPLISIQRSFGYSDVTPKNDMPGRVDELYVNCVEKVKLLEAVGHFYKSAALNSNVLADVDIDTVCLPVYVMQSKADVSGGKSISREFEGRQEFEMNYLDAVSDDADGRWKTLQHIVRLAVQKEEDVIIICQHDHRFTEAYKREAFVRNVIHAYKYGVGMMCGSINRFSQIVPLSTGCYWIDQVTGSLFMVIYHSAYNEILREQLPPGGGIDGLLSEIITNKTVVYPFISSHSASAFGPESTIEFGKSRELYDLCTRRLDKVSRALQVV